MIQAAVAAQRAPSIFNTQPWRWNIHDDIAELRADHDHQLAAVDPEARMLILSCGVALHHARIALSATGHVPEATRLPDPHDPDLLATLRVASFTPAPAALARLHQAIALRHTDRRPFADQPVPETTLTRLRAAAHQQGARLHLLRPDQTAVLGAAAYAAAISELANPDYRTELATWTHRGADTGDGVPLHTAAPTGPRPVPVRDFAPDAPHRPVHTEATDRHARYAILSTDGDDPAAWLTAGEALSAVLLTATADRLATSPMSDVIEVPATRHLLRDLTGHTGHPMIALRIGIPADATQPAPTAPRHSGTALITTTSADA
ncbi:nitroreductase [Planosporangium thailandense]|uniref:Nitroreductase n=1 Tax=Planosporangium thailandense TaxID=765197 RepID=A0ABX0XZ18_9ACTN|nr:nitroreductase [Planosporangium thailandense]